MDQRWVEGRSTIQRNEECMYSVAECEVTLEKEVSKIVLNKGYDKFRRKLPLKCLAPTIIR